MVRYNGILPVNKEGGMTSHDVINCLRRITGQKKIGHTGTLDPMATGLLLTCFGRATPLSQFMTGWDKTYRAEITLGKISDTFDADGNIKDGGIVPRIDDKEMAEVLNSFIGRSIQKVPPFSAVKVKGKRLYKKARTGETVDCPEREIEIKSIELLGSSGPHLNVEIKCSKGTYIRRLADDIGSKLGYGAYLSALERTNIGPFELDDAVSLAEVASLHETDTLVMAMRPLERVLEFPVINFNNEAAGTIKHGSELTYNDVINWEGDFLKGDLISMADEQGQILAIAKSKCDAGELKKANGNSFYSYVRVLI